MLLDYSKAVKIQKTVHLEQPVDFPYLAIICMKYFLFFLNTASMRILLFDIDPNRIEICQEMCLRIYNNL